MVNNVKTNSEFPLTVLIVCIITPRDPSSDLPHAFDVLDNCPNVP